VAGAWFKALPTTTILAAEVDRDARWVLEQLIALTIPEALTNEIVISATEGEIHVSGYEMAEGCDPSKITITIAADGSDPLRNHRVGRGDAMVLPPSITDEGCNQRSSEVRPVLVEATETDGDNAPLLKKAKQPTIPRLAVLDRMPLSRAPPEVILYVPGFNASVKDEVAAL